MDGNNPPDEETFQLFNSFNGSTTTLNTIKTWMIEFTPDSGGKLYVNGKDRINNSS